MSDTEKKDDETSVEDIVLQIKNNIKNRNISDTNIKVIKDIEIVGDGELKQNIDYINSNWDVSNVEYNISSHHRIIGRLLVWGRRLVHGEVIRYTNLIFGKQSEFNASMVRISNLIDKDTDSKIDTKIRELVVSMDKDTDSKIGTKIRELTVSLDRDIYSKINDVVAKHMQESSSTSKWSKFYKREINEDLLKQNIGHHDHLISLINKYATQISQGNTSKLVEVGIGSATMSIYLSRTFFYDVVGIDSDPIIITSAMDANTRLGGYAKFLCIDAFDLKNFFREKLFDVAFSQGTLEHFDNDNLKKIIDAQLYVAKCVIFSVPSINYQYREFGNERKTDIKEWEFLLKSFGYTIEHLSYYQEGNIHIVGIISDRKIDNDKVT